jgi:hypothetical protein
VKEYKVLKDMANVSAEERLNYFAENGWTLNTALSVGKFGQVVFIIEREKEKK